MRSISEKRAHIDERLFYLIRLDGFSAETLSAKKETRRNYYRYFPQRGNRRPGKGLTRGGQPGVRRVEGEEYCELVIYEGVH